VTVQSDASPAPVEPVAEEQYLEPGIETASREEITAWQEKRVVELVAYAWENSRFYRELWSNAGVTGPGDVRSLAEFSARIPTFSKSDIRAYRERTGDPFGGLLCVEPSTLTSITSTSGTTSAPEPLPEQWDESPPLPTMSIRSLWEIGLRPGDRALVPTGSFRNYVAPSYHALGLVPVFCDGWIGQGERILQAIEKHQVSYVQLFLPTVMEFEQLEAKYDIAKMVASLKGASFAGQPLGAVLTRKVKEDWSINLMTYTSAGDTGTAWEGAERDGYHLHEDTVYPEFLDPQTDDPVADGEIGELIATDLDNLAAPYIRFRSEDLVRMTREPTPSGRTHARTWVVGRVGDELRIGSKALVLADMWALVESLPECGDALFQVVKYAPTMEVLRMRIGYAPERTSDVDELHGRAVALLGKELGVEVEVEMMTVDAIMATSTSVAKFPRTVKA
jgi:phenylacetate-coenzyme A ligase PaaK-like adenylate-forming protein